MDVVAESQRFVATVKMLAEENESLKKLNAAMEHDNEELQKSNKSLLDTAELQRHKEDGLRAVIQQNEEEIKKAAEKANKELYELHEVIEGLDENIAGIKDENRKLGEDFRDLQVVFDQENAKRKQLVSENCRLKGRIETLEDGLESRQISHDHEIREAKRECEADLERVRSTLTNDRAELARTIKTLRKENNQLADSTQALKAERDELADKVAALHAERDELAEEVERVKAVSSAHPEEEQRDFEKDGLPVARAPRENGPHDESGTGIKDEATPETRSSEPTNHLLLQLPENLKEELLRFVRQEVQTELSKRTAKRKSNGNDSDHDSAKRVKVESLD